jgi:hypothetical protein
VEANLRVLAPAIGSHEAVTPTGDQDPHEPYEVIHLGRQAAAIVPLSDLRRLQAVERRALAEVLKKLR